MSIVLRLARAPLVTIALLACAALAARCDTGGLLVTEHKGEPQKPVLGPSVNGMVNAGTFAHTSKYRLFYTNGQATPNQGVSTSPKTRLNGGIVGAAQ